MAVAPGLRIGVLREFRAGETRVALVPEAVKRLTAAGHAVRVEAGCGEASGFSDQEYADAGALLVKVPGPESCLWIDGPFVVFLLYLWAADSSSVRPDLSDRIKPSPMYPLAG